MHVDDDPEAHHAKVGAHILRQSHLQKLIELFIDIFQLLLDGSFGKDILLPQHFGGLFRKQILAAFHHVRHLTEDLPVHLLRGDMSPKARVVDHVARLITHQSSFGGMTKFILNETGKKRLSRHRDSLALSGVSSASRDMETKRTSFTLAKARSARRE